MGKDNRLDIVKRVEELQKQNDKFKREYKFLEWRITDLEIRYQQSIRRNEVLKRKLQEYELLLATKVEI